MLANTNTGVDLNRLVGVVWEEGVYETGVVQYTDIGKEAEINEKYKDWYKYTNIEERGRFELKLQKMVYKCRYKWKRHISIIKEKIHLLSTKILIEKRQKSSQISHIATMWTMNRARIVVLDRQDYLMHTEKPKHMDLPRTLLARQNNCFQWSSEFCL